MHMAKVLTKKSFYCTEVKILKCNECDKTFASKSGFDKHIQHHTGQYSYNCNVCQKGFNNKYNFDAHVMAHEGRGYACDFCGKVFKTKHGMRYHRSEHTGQYKFHCEKCGKGFNEKGTHQKHACT